MENKLENQCVGLKNQNRVQTQGEYVGGANDLFGSNVLRKRNRNLEMYCPPVNKFFPEYWRLNDANNRASPPSSLFAHR